MAEQVASWPEKYGCDGIDLDIEDGAGNAKGAGTNMVHFIRKLRELSPNMIISQPTYGYPSVNCIDSFTVFLFMIFFLKRLVLKSMPSTRHGMLTATQTTWKTR